jgi:hypothetical protein
VLLEMIDALREGSNLKPERFEFVKRVSHGHTLDYFLSGANCSVCNWGLRITVGKVVGRKYERLEVACLIVELSCDICTRKSSYWQSCGVEAKLRSPILGICLSPSSEGLSN